MSLNGVLFEVDAALIGERVTLRFDPAAPLAPVQVVHQGQLIEQARRVDLYANCFVRRHHPSGQPQVARPQTLRPSETAAPAAPAAVPLAMAALARDDPDDRGDCDPLTRSR